MNCSGKKTQTLTKYKKLNRWHASCPRPFLLHSCYSSAWCLWMQMLFPQWKPSKPHTHSHQQESSFSTVVTTHATYACSYFAPHEEGKMRPKQPRTLLEQCYHSQVPYEGPVVLYIHVQRVQKALPWLMLPHVVDLAVLLINHWHSIPQALSCLSRKGFCRSPIKTSFFIAR